MTRKCESPNHEGMPASRRARPLHTPLPPLPLPQPSAAYTARLLRDPEVAPRKPPVSGGELSAVASRGGCPHIGLRGEDGLLAPMLLWDATMAHAIAAALGRWRV